MDVAQLRFMLRKVRSMKILQSMKDTLCMMVSREGARIYLMTTSGERYAKLPGKAQHHEKEQGPWWGAFEDALLEAPSYGEYRWNLMADRLHLYAERNEWKKRSNGNKAQGNS